MIRLSVWLTTPSGEKIKAGELVVDDPDAQGALMGQFRYDPDYPVHPKAVPLDPIHLPFSSEIFSADRPFAGIHGVFEDSLPDDWGRKLMVRKYKLARDRQRAPYLLQVLGRQGMGALRYGEEGEPPCSETGVGISDLDKIVRLAEQFDRNPDSGGDELALLFQAGSSPGGARPKALVDGNGKFYIAKFSSVRDQFDVVALEAAAMEMASVAGVGPALTAMIHCASRKVLLVERFDVSSGRGRNHLVSLQTLLSADGYYNLSYRDIADVVRRISAEPAQDVERLYRQMIFNIMIGNTDDHLKNFSMICGESGWRLSPAYDLVPNIGFNREHVLRVGFENRSPTRNTVLQEAKYFGLKRKERAQSIMNEVQEAVSDWKKVFEKFDVPDKDSSVIGEDIQKRLKRLGD
ncbi:MAG: type II toxin-antitoxin system HipA family toxin [Desulfobulbaceae bacterium]|nr:type II toxin-antitoxin system HipA family toxin [Desulfobulbaceae bacterium]MCK5340791.1 type II toxin-antitoxin system HipA family toxin [Desulfobulbaceae bacterium]MCK5404054.1 type II toxin-antitoxin system HipA family toxin [Desulfobulbaceae bacterium]